MERELPQRAAATMAMSGLGMHLIPLAFSQDTDFTEFHGLNQR